MTFGFEKGRQAGSLCRPRIRSPFLCEPIAERECKYMSFFSVFVGQNNQSLQKSAFFCQNLANSLVGEAELFAELDVKAHGRHRSQQFVGLLPDEVVPFDGGWSHDDRSLKMFNF